VDTDDYTPVSGFWCVASQPFFFLKNKAGTLSFIKVEKILQPKSINSNPAEVPSLSYGYNQAHKDDHQSNTKHKANHKQSRAN
jgi:hypothetical protein